MDLLAHRRNAYSQNGEDGIIEAVFAAIGEGGRWCCEFGAWDGLHFANTRALVEQGWNAVLVEGDPERFQELLANNAGNPRVHAFNELVDAAALERILGGIPAPELDLLVVDIDGLDFDVLAGLTLRPRVVCVEVNAGHDPDARDRLCTGLAAANIGQPFGLFHELMTGRGYQLAAYSGNAFYVLADDRLPALEPAAAYAAFLATLDAAERRWLFHVNRGDVDPFHRFGNRRLTRAALGLERSYMGWSLRARRPLHRLGRAWARLRP